MDRKKTVSKGTDSGNLVKIILIIVMIFGLFYLLTYYIDKKKKNNEETGTNYIPYIQYNEILIGSLLNQSASDYYVLIASKEDYRSTYASLISSYNADNKFYYAFLDNGFNRSFINDESNTNAENINDFKVNGLTLVKVSSGRIIESYEKTESILGAFLKINGK
jgi:hypothetical protein